MATSYHAPARHNREANRPLAPRRTAGLLVLLAAAGTVVSFAGAVTLGGGVALIVLTVFGALILPTLVSPPFLVRAADDVWHARHEGDRMPFWAPVRAPAPLVFDWPDGATGGRS